VVLWRDKPCADASLGGAPPELDLSALDEIQTMFELADEEGDAATRPRLGRAGRGEGTCSVPSLLARRWERLLPRPQRRRRRE